MKQHSNVIILKEIEKNRKNKRRMISGLPHEVAQQLIQLQNELEVDEIMILPNVYGHTHRTKLIELIAHACLDNGRVSIMNALIFICFINFNVLFTTSLFS